MATAWAAAGLTLTLMNRRPMVVRSAMKIATAAATAAIQIVLGMPRVRVMAKAASAGGAPLGTPSDTISATPNSTALTPMVVTRAGTRKRVMNSPLTSPAANPIPTATAIHAASSARDAPADGSLVTITAAKDMIPATEISRPRCWITRCWPMAAIARMATKGNSDRKALADTVLGAMTAPTAISSTVASTAGPASDPNTTPRSRPAQPLLRTVAASVSVRGRVILEGSVGWWRRRYGTGILYRQESAHLQPVRSRWAPEV